MGTSKNAYALSFKLASAAEMLSSDQVAIDAAAMAVKTVFQQTLREAGVTGTTKVSRGIKVRYDKKDRAGRPGAFVRYTGAAHLLNNPTGKYSSSPRSVRQPYGIISRKNRGTRADRSSRESGVGTRGAILVNGQPKAYARHPGTRGMGFYEKAVPIAEKVAPIAYHKAGPKAVMRTVFR